MKEKIVLITGVTREMGLGFALVKGYADEGHRVFATGRDLNRVQDLTANLKGVEALQLDITDLQSVEACIATISAKAARLDVLVNNAAAFFDAGNTVVDSDLQQVGAAFDTNVLGAWRLSVAALPLLKKSEAAAIVNVTSGAGSFHDPMFGMDHHPQHVPVYAVTKAAANAMTVKLAVELKDAGIRVNAVCPGWIATYPGTAEMGARPVDEAVPGIIWASDYSKHQATGKFFRDKLEIDF